jgi:hypothetical protein
MNECACGVGGIKMTGKNRNTWSETHHSVTLFTTKAKLTVLILTDRWLITSLTTRLMYFVYEIKRHVGSSENVRIVVVGHVIFDTQTDDRHKNTPFVKCCLSVNNYRQQAEDGENM